MIMNIIDYTASKNFRRMKFNRNPSCGFHIRRKHTKSWQRCTYVCKNRFFILILLLVLLLFFWEFFSQTIAECFPLEFVWRQVSSSPRTVLSILADLNNAVIWIVSTRPLIFKSSSPLNNPSLTILRTPITIGIKFHVPQFFSIP